MLLRKMIILIVVKKEIRHQQGEKNSQFGKMWITDGQSNQKLSNTTTIPDGWRRGRIMRP